MHIFLPLLVTVCICRGVSGDVFNKLLKTKVESFIDDVIKCKEVPGLTLAVVSGGETWTRGFGYADIHAGRNVTAQTLFGIGSLTKAFSTTLLAMLLEESQGRFNWTSKVRDVLGPDFAFTDQVRTSHVTLRDLLTHRTGLHPAIFALFAVYSHNFTLADFAKRFRFLPEVRPLRDQFEYNNWVYTLVGHVVEVLSGESWEDTLKKRLFNPLGMDKSRVIGRTVAVTDPTFAKPYYMVENKLIVTDPSIYDIHPGESAGAIASSADDMAKWLHFLLQNETAQHVKLVKSKTIRETFSTYESLTDNWIQKHSIYKPVYPESDVLFSYGYGWFQSTYKGYRVILHSGGLHSFSSYLTFYPDLDLAIFTSINGLGAERFEQKLLHYYIADMVMGHTPWLNTTTACTFPEPWAPLESKVQNNSDVMNVPVECLTCFTGTYGHYMFGDMEITAGSGSRSLQLHYGNVLGTLNSTRDEHKFKLDLMAPFKLFSRPGNDTVLVNVEFHSLEKQKYREIHLIYQHKMVFTRGVSFYDDVHSITSNATPNKCNSLFSITLLCLSCVYTSVML